MIELVAIAVAARVCILSRVQALRRGELGIHRQNVAWYRCLTVARRVHCVRQHWRLAQRALRVPCELSILLLMYRRQGHVLQERLVAVRLHLLHLLMLLHLHEDLLAERARLVQLLLLHRLERIVLGVRHGEQALLMHRVLNLFVFLLSGTLDGDLGRRLKWVFLAALRRSLPESLAS